MVAATRTHLDLQKAPPAEVRLATPAATTSTAPRAGADYNLQIVWSLARYVEEHFGPDALGEVATAGGLQPSDFHRKNQWVSWQSFEAILAKARSLMTGDDEFKRACIHRIKEAYGPLRYILWATTPAQVLAQASKQYALVSRCGELSLRDHGATWAHMSFKSSTPFSRLGCLVRHAQSVTLPTLWGLPPGHLRETACVAWGDPTCELRVHWYQARRWLPVVLGAVVFAGLGLVLMRFGLTTLPTPVALAILGALLGYVIEARRTDRVNHHTRDEIMNAFRDLAHEEADARRELLEMHTRQKEWTRLVEEEMGARTSAFQKLAGGVTELHEARATAVLGVSHDLRNPLQIIQMSSEYLKTSAGIVADSDAVDSVRDIQTSVDRMRRMLGDLVNVTKAQRDFVTMAPQQVETGELTESLRRRLRALVHGREVRATVFATREVPEHVQIDPLALDRIVDNLLTNAAKYTERGSIVVEVDGSPGFLVVKVSDTGCGIQPEELERVFEVGGSSAESRRGDSFGVGLSVVVQLLDQMGGRLEIMSKPGSGTTFWVYLPVRAGRAPKSVPDPRVVRAPSPEVDTTPVRSSRSRIVSIRTLSA
jgi:signal transduction histidine kinase